MKFRFLASAIIVSAALFSCNSSSKKVESENTNGHKIEVKEVLQANAYTYILAKENGGEYWLAAPKMVVETGAVLFYENGMEMTNFESKDLERTFESIYFVQEITDKPKAAVNEMMAQQQHHGKPIVEKKSIKIDPAEGGISLSELFENKEKYNGKKVIVKGKVVKVNKGIMNKNWFHIQDGTEGSGLYDLTITSLAEEVEIDDVLTFEGTFAVDKDFGHGYKYNVILEDAEVK
ncbi:MAG: SH3-like domain-containing protein [Salinivirgaceae bacterium]|nr:SH3-like domain-containing protein [Salinivirgaceae bacterium]